MDRDMMLAILASHHTHVSPELLQCACGWYAKRGVGAADLYDSHVVDALLAGGVP